MTEAVGVPTEAGTTSIFEYEMVSRASREQMDRLIALLAEMVEEAKEANWIAARTLALDEWRMGQGRHPDD